MIAGGNGCAKLSFQLDARMFMPIESFKGDYLFLPQNQLQFRVLRCGTMQHWPIFRYSDNIIEMFLWPFQTMCFDANVPHVHIKWFGLVWTSKPHCHGKGRLHGPAIRMAGPCP